MAAAFVVFFLLVWLFVGVLLGFLSGWFSLMRAFPDRPQEAPLAVFKHESGSLRGASMSGILTVSPCPSGLRVGIWKLFGPFHKDFLVPWNELRVSRKRILLWKFAELSFGTNYGRLRIRELLADRLRNSVPQYWPETEAPEPITGTRVFRSYFLEWLAYTTFAAGFLIVAPRLLFKGSGPYPPVAVAILFPAIGFGLFTTLSYLLRRK